MKYISCGLKHFVGSTKFHFFQSSYCSLLERRVMGVALDQDVLKQGSIDVSYFYHDYFSTASYFEQSLSPRTDLRILLSH